jgi:S2P endopeptidase
MFLFPGAYVDLCSDHLVVITPVRQLRIFCAGVWHNFVLVLVAFALLKCHPLLLDALFVKQPYFSHVQDQSPLKSILKENAVVYSVSNCQVTNAFTFYDCLFRLDKNLVKSNGYCMASEQIVKVASTISTF